MPGQFRILLVEDDLNDVALLKRAFSKRHPVDWVQVVNNGLDAMSYLEGSGRFRDRTRFPLPDLLLLDLTLPGISGFEVLEWLRTASQFHSLPVIVLTASSAIRDAQQAYRLGANSFITKPIDSDSLETIFERFLRAPSASSPPPISPPSLQAS